MTAYLEEIKYHGEAALRAGNELLELLLVPSWGSNLISITVKEQGLELLRTPGSAEEYYHRPILYGIPLLFPPNRIDRGKFTFNGREYQFPINEPAEDLHNHGFVYDKEWKLRNTAIIGEQIIIETEFNSRLFPELKSYFSHDFLMQLSYTLTKGRINKEVAIKNLGREAFPLGFGFHTSFAFPLKSADSGQQATFRASVVKRWQLDERNLPTKSFDQMYVEELVAGTDLSGWTLDDAFLADTALHGKNQVQINHYQEGLKIVYSCDDNFKHWVIYNGDGKQGFVCPEPYTWITNAPNLDLPAERTGLQVLEPNQKIFFKSVIDITKFD